MQTTPSLDEIFKTRRSVRAYRKDPLRPGDLQAILNAVFLSPSGAAKQGIQLIAVTDPALKIQIRAVCEQGEQEWVMQQDESVKNTILIRDEAGTPGRRNKTLLLPVGRSGALGDTSCGRLKIRFACLCFAQERRVTHGFRQ